VGVIPLTGAMFMDDFVPNNQAKFRGDKDNLKAKSKAKPDIVEEMDFDEEDLQNIVLDLEDFDTMNTFEELKFIPEISGHHTFKKA